MITNNAAITQLNCNPFPWPIDVYGVGESPMLYD